MKKIIAIVAITFTLGVGCKKEEIKKPCDKPKVDQSTLKDRKLM